VNGDASTQGEQLSVDVEVVLEHVRASLVDQMRLADLARFTLAAERQHGRWSITVALVSDDALRELHHRFMGIPTVTDVMTFPHGDDAHGQSENGGDIVISLDRAMDQGPEHGMEWWREAEFLLVHGLLHLCGWRDDTRPQREAMLRRQQELMEKADAGLS
jgi:rRNA maturation RNase YbeY